MIPYSPMKICYFDLKGPQCTTIFGKHKVKYVIKAIYKEEKKKKKAWHIIAYFLKSPF